MFNFNKHIYEAKWDQNDFKEAWDFMPNLAGLQCCLFWQERVRSAAIALRCFPLRRHSQCKEWSQRFFRVWVLYQLENVNSEPDTRIHSCNFRERRAGNSRYVSATITFATSGLSGFEFQCGDHNLRYLETNSLFQE